ncbi:MAG: hypothetical protein NVSMB68_08080 [Thermoanaerobaculia bacterium]
MSGVAEGAGCNLALACEYRIASDGARLAQSFTRIGLHPDWGGTFFLPRIAGKSVAFEMMSTGRIVEADEALRIGLVDRVVSGSALVEESTRLARTIASGPPLAIAGIKRALAASERNELEAQIDLENEHQLRAFRSGDAREGMAAFFEKRAPKFEGR